MLKYITAKIEKNVRIAVQTLSLWNESCWFVFSVVSLKPQKTSKHTWCFLGMKRNCVLWREMSDHLHVVLMVNNSLARFLLGKNLITWPLKFVNRFPEFTFAWQRPSREEQLCGNSTVCWQRNLITDQTHLKQGINITHNNQIPKSAGSLL